MSAPSFSSFQAPKDDKKATKKANKDRQAPKSKTSKNRDRRNDSRIRDTVRETSLLWDDERDLGSSKWDQDHTSLCQSSTSLWVEDNKGDPMTVQYGSLHTRSIPRYRRSAYGSVVGLAPEWRIPKATDSSASEVSNHREGSGPGITSTRFLAAFREPSQRLTLKPKLARDDNSSEGEFIPIRRKHRNPEGSKLLRGYEDVTSDSDQETQSDTELPQTYLSSEQVAIKDLEMKLAETPTTIELWLSLLHHSISQCPLNGANATQARSDIAISILQRAFKTHQANVSSSALRVAYLSYGEAVWSNQQLQEEWQKAIGLCQSDSVWFEWLEWRARSVKASSFDNFLIDAKRCLRSIKQESAKLLVLWRIILVLIGAGFHEMATAIIQAQSDLMFNAPQDVKALPFSSQVEMYEEIWESECPRIGELGAVGWAASVNQPAVPGTVDTIKTLSQQQNVRRTGDPYESWLLDEKISERRLPRHAAEGNQDEDPFSIVVFEDIRDFIIETKDQQLCLLFKRVVLSALGLHLPGLYKQIASYGRPGIECRDSWSRVELLRHGMLRSLFSRKAEPQTSLPKGGDNQISGPQLQRVSGLGPLKDWSYESISPLRHLSVTPQFGLWTSTDLEGLDVPFVRAVFAQLQQQHDPAWDQLALAFEAAYNTSKALKLSKNFLSTHRNSLMHWHWHAELEQLRGNASECRKIFEAALLATESSEDNHYRHKLFCSWALLEWTHNHPQLSVTVMCRTVGIQSASPSGIEILRAKRLLDEMTGSGELRDAVSLVSMRALLEVLTTSLHDGMKVFDRYLDQARLLAGSPEREALVCESCILIYHHMVTIRGMYQRSEIRRRIANAVAEFPENTIILACFLEIERGEGLWGRVRGLIGDGQTIRSKEELARNSTFPLDKSLSRKVWEIWVMTSWFNGSDMENEVPRLRRYFYAEQHNPYVSASLIFWRLNVEFEIRAGSLKRAKDVLYSAVSHCPMNKDLYLMAFGPLRSVFTPDELNRWIEVMFERGVRLRVDLQPYLEGWHPQVEDEAGAGHDDGAGEIEEMAVEYRRLLPY